MVAASFNQPLRGDAVPMSWLLLVILNATPPNGSRFMWSERFPNQESCDSIKIWVQTYADVVRAVCLPDIVSTPDPELKDLPTEVE